MKSSSKRPTSLSANAVQTAVLKPKQRRKPRATLYSPPPSQALNSRAVRTLPSPGSNRSMISPKAIMSYLHEPAGLISRIAMLIWLIFESLFLKASEEIGGTRRQMQGGRRKAEGGRRKAERGKSGSG